MSRASASPRPVAADVRMRTEGPFAAGFVPWQRRAGETVLTIVVKATYALESELCPLLDEPESLQDVDGFWDDDQNRSLHAPSDMALMKPSAEVIVVGHAYAKDARPAQSITARLAIGSIDKMLETCPQRRFDREGRLSVAAPAARMPLHYEAAAGGAGTDNPVGVDPTDFGEGGSRRVPGVLPPNLDLRPGEHIATVGFGPIAPHWPPRARLLRPQDEAWLRAPTERPMPQGFDARYFLVAPQDQRAVEPFRPDERLILEGLSKHSSRLVTNLAGVAPSLAIIGLTNRPAPLLSADLLCIDTDRGVATLTYRGHLAFEAAMPAITIVVATRGEHEASAAVHVPSAALHTLSSHVNDATAELPRQQLARSAARIAAEKVEALETTHVESDPEAVRAAVLPFASSPASEGRGRIPSQPDAALPFRGQPGDASPPPPAARSIDDASARARPDKAVKIPSSPPPSVASVPPPLPSRPSALPPPSSAGVMKGSALPPLRPSAPPAPVSSSPVAPLPPAPPIVSAISVPSGSSATPPPPALVAPPAPASFAPPPLAPPPLAVPSPLGAPPPLAPSLSALPAPPPMAAPLSASSSSLTSSLSSASMPIPPARGSTVGERMGAAASFESLSAASKLDGGARGSDVRGSDAVGESSRQEAPRKDSSRPRDAFQMAFRGASGGSPRDGADAAKHTPFDSAKDASDAALRAERRDREAREKRAESSEPVVVRRRALVDLLAFDGALPRRLRRAKAFAEVLADFSPPRVPRRPDEPESDRDREERGRLDVLRVLSCGVPVDDLATAVERGLDDANDLELPLFLVGGELRPTFDEVEALRAAVAVAQPLAGSDKRVGAAVAVANDALASSNPIPRQTAVGLLRQVESATASLSLPPRYLAEQVEHALLVNRRYRKPTILGEGRVRADLVTSAGTTYPAYLSEAVSLRLPMLLSFPIVALVELHPREDAAETAADALLVTALARVVRTVRTSR